MIKDCIRVLIAEDNRLVRIGITSLLALHSDVEVVGEAVDGAQAVSLARATKPDVLLLDLRMPVFDGVEVIKQLLREDPAANILVLTNYDGEEDVFRAMQAGAKGYLTKDGDPQEIVVAIRSVAAGAKYIAPGALSRLTDRMKQPELTRRETQMLERIAKGLSNRQIADDLGLSERTCAVHVGTLLTKLDVQSRTQAVAVGLRRGLLRSES